MKDVQLAAATGREYAKPRTYEDGLTRLARPLDGVVIVVQMLIITVLARLGSQW